MLNSQLLAALEDTLWISKPRSASRRRRDAYLYAAIAERHMARGDDEQLVAALVRAAFRAHQEADNDAVRAPVVPP